MCVSTVFIFITFNKDQNMNTVSVGYELRFEHMVCSGPNGCMTQQYTNTTQLCQYVEVNFVRNTVKLQAVM